MKKGEELKDHLASITPKERAEYLIHEINPYLAISPDNKAIHSNDEAEKKYILNASKLFDCKKNEIEKCYNQYGYPLPIGLYLELFYGQTEIEIDKLISKTSAKILWEEVEKQNIDKAIEKYEKDYIEPYLRGKEQKFLKGANQRGFEERKKEKPCKSFTRARAFCILIMQEKKKLPALSKNELITTVKKYFPEQSGKTVYNCISIEGLSLLSGEGQYKIDYDYGLILYKEMFPD